MEEIIQLINSIAANVEAAEEAQRLIQQQKTELLKVVRDMDDLGVEELVTKLRGAGEERRSADAEVTIRDGAVEFHVPPGAEAKERGLLKAALTAQGIPFTSNGASFEKVEVVEDYVQQFIAAIRAWRQRVKAVRSLDDYVPTGVSANARELRRRAERLEGPR